MTTMLNAFSNAEDFTSSSAHAFSHYRENDHESYASKYLPPLPPPSSSPSSFHASVSSPSQKTSSVLLIGEPFSALIHSLVPSPQFLLHDADEQTIFDEYGFRVDVGESEQQQYQVVAPVDDEAAKQKWLAHLHSTYKVNIEHIPFQEQDILQKIDPKQLRQDAKLAVLLHETNGIPASLRTQLWMCLSGCIQKKHRAKTSYTDMLKLSNNDAQVHCKQIEKDLLRTLPTNACFMTINASGVSRLRRILRTIAWLFPGRHTLILRFVSTDSLVVQFLDIGYCQVNRFSEVRSSSFLVCRAWVLFAPRCCSSSKKRMRFG